MTKSGVEEFANLDFVFIEKNSPGANINPKGSFLFRAWVTPIRSTIESEKDSLSKISAHKKTGRNDFQIFLDTVAQPNQR